MKWLAILVIALIIFGLGFLFGEGAGWLQCVKLGLNVVKIDNVIDKDLIQAGILKYKESLGGWAFDPKSPFYIGINKSNSTS